MDQWWNNLSPWEKEIILNRISQNSSNNHYSQQPIKYLLTNISVSKKRYIHYLYKNHKNYNNQLGIKYFYGHKFINRNVLDPRYDSEIIVEEILKYINNNNQYSILDMGLGSGCLIISILLNSSNSRGWGLDINNNAIYTSNRNKNYHNISEQRLKIIHSNWFNNINRKFDILVCNPPYIAHNLIHNNDPINALDGGMDGLKHYRIIFPKIKYYIKKIAIFEICHFLLKPIKQLLFQNNLNNFTVKKDLNGLNRIIIIYL